MEALRRDVLDAFRALRHDAGFSVVVALTLTLGIAGNAGILGVAAATFFGRLPFPESDRILRLYASLRRPDGTTSTVTIRGRESTSSGTRPPVRWDPGLRASVTHSRFLIRTIRTTSISQYSYDS